MGVRGVEPLFSASKADVLPLDDTPNVGLCRQNRRLASYIGIIVVLYRNSAEKDTLGYIGLHYYMNLIMRPATSSLRRSARTLNFAISE